MPDQSTDTPPTKRMTTAEVAALAQQTAGELTAAQQNASTALRVAQSTDDMVAAMSEKITDLHTRLAEVASNAGSPPVGDLVHEYPNRDQVDSRIHEALAPLHEEVHELRQRGTLTPESEQSLRGILSRLEGVEAAVKGLDDPVSQTLAEDALADQIQAAVDRVVENLIVADDNARKRLDWLTSQLTSAATSGGTAGGTGAQRKVLELMRQVTHIGKEKEANLGEKGGRFKFRGIDDAMDAVGHAMREVGLILSPEVLKDETTVTPVTNSGTNQNGTTWSKTLIWTSTKLTMRYTFIDPDDGSSHPIEMVGEGRDVSDKSTSKAASMAAKYGLFQALMVPVTGLDDSDDAPPQVMQQEGATTQPEQRAAAPAQQPKRTAEETAARARDALEAIRNIYRVPGGAQAQYNRLVAIMNHARSEGLLSLTLDGASLYQHGHAALATLQAPPPDSNLPPEPPMNDEGAGEYH